VDIDAVWYEDMMWIGVHEGGL